jgi:hypothetical protein
MRKYRLDSNFELIGGFWRYGTPDQTFTGTVSSRSGRVDLLTAPTLKPLNQNAFREAFLAANNRREFEPIGTICGFTTERRCSLLGTVVIDDEGLNDFPSQQQVHARRYRAWRAVMGLHIESSEATCVDSAAFYYTKIDNWLPNPWGLQIADETSTYTVPWRAKEAFRFNSNALSAELICQVFSGGSTKGLKKEARIKSVPRIKVVPKSPQSLDWFNSIAFRIENFFTLFLGTSVALKRVQLFQGDDEGWLVQKTRLREEKVNFQAWVKCQQDRVASALEKWLAVPEDKRPLKRRFLA